MTGGTSGIGREVARRFGEAGAVIVVDIREQPEEDDESAPTHELIEDNDGRAEFIETDVSDPTDVGAVVEAAREFGGVGVMVNNAGIYREASLIETDDDAFDQVFAINVRGVFAGCRAAARDMLEREEPGSIVNTASISSEYAQVGHSMYDASKGAVMMLTRVAALELARYDIRVNAVAPGIIETTFGDGNPDFDRELGDGFILNDADLPDLNAREIDPEIPMGRTGTPDDLAGSYLFPSSDERLD
ncbi:SDR family NAD(P)-dependent oxidoreductase [Natrinema versiforme]|uniref:Short-chain dehydrogenase/reductase SDR n=1 Tax=Natrinema versiforme JCM 10478 TaxID=1227496 RepID=L9XMB0_9EURY|nr:SDR family oxidoreductase [Natrinema versiforme]ELY62929.1 short-chain dehydrogenase/reductase SDR [Natrinema versiforme JCM 10478]